MIAFSGDTFNSSPLIQDRIRSGIAAAKARGKRLGRQPGQRPKSDRLAAKVLTLVQEGRSYRLIAREVGLSKNTVADIIKRSRATAVALLVLLTAIPAWAQVAADKTPQTGEHVLPSLLSRIAAQPHYGNRIWSIGTRPSTYEMTAFPARIPPPPVGRWNRRSIATRIGTMSMYSPCFAVAIDASNPEFA